MVFVYLPTKLHSAKIFQRCLTALKLRKDVASSFKKRVKYHLTINSLSTRIYYQNVRGINSKLDTLNRIISMSRYDIIILSETWLNNKIVDAKLGLYTPYSIIRCDR